MTPSLALGVLVFTLGVIALVFTCHLLVCLARDYRELKRQDDEYARQWVATHKAHQDRGRYLTDDPNRPEN